MPFGIQEKVSTNDTSIAITEHRLGLVYAKAADFRKAVHLLQKALVAYGAANMRPEHSCIQDAAESLNECRVKQLEKELQRGTPILGQGISQIFLRKNQSGSVAVMKVQLYYSPLIRRRTIS